VYTISSYKHKRTSNLKSKNKVSEMNLLIDKENRERELFLYGADSTV
jgi:hypothetical protein